MPTTTSPIGRARRVAATVTDPEMPMLTLRDLGILRDVRQSPDGSIVITLTPTYTGCPAMDTMRADLRRALKRAGLADIDIQTSLAPAWSSDWISAEGRRKLAEHGIAPPAAAPVHRPGPVPLTLVPHPPTVRCPRCDSTRTEQTSQFGSTACKSLHRCLACGEPFDRFREL